MVLQFLQPSRHILKAHSLRDVVHQQRTNRSPVVRAGDRSIALLPGSVPDLRFDDFSFRGDDLRGELDTDRGLGLQIKLVAGESGEPQVTSGTGVPRRGADDAWPSRRGHVWSELKETTVVAQSIPYRRVRKGAKRAQWQSKPSIWTSKMRFLDQNSKVPKLCQGHRLSV